MAFEVGDKVIKKDDSTKTVYEVIQSYYAPNFHSPIGYSIQKIGNPFSLEYVEESSIQPCPEWLSVLEDLDKAEKLQYAPSSSTTHIMFIIANLLGISFEEVEDALTTCLLGKDKEDKTRMIRITSYFPHYLFEDDYEEMMNKYRKWSKKDAKVKED